MTELMKRYEAEMWLDAQLESPEPKTIEKFQEIIRNQCDEISALKAQLTWRPVSEKPEKYGLYFVKDCGFYEMMKYEKGKWYSWDKMFGEWLIETLCGDEEYLLIPPATEGEVK